MDTVVLAHGEAEYMVYTGIVDANKWGGPGATPSGRAPVPADEEDLEHEGDSYDAPSGERRHHDWSLSGRTMLQLRPSFEFRRKECGQQICAPARLNPIQWLNQRAQPPGKAKPRMAFLRITNEHSF